MGPLADATGSTAPAARRRQQLAALFTRLRRRRVFGTDLGGGGWDVSAYLSTDRWFHGHLHISEYSRMVAGHESSPRARVILGGVDADKFSPAAAADEGVLFVGRLLPHKGVHDLIDAVAPDVPLRIVGRALDADYANNLRARAAGKCVTFVHDADDEQSSPNTRDPVSCCRAVHDA